MLVLKNARILFHPLVHTLVIDKGKIAAIEPGNGLIDQVSIPTKIYNLEGKTVIPGLVDGHLHLQTMALSLRSLPCDTPSRQECLEKVAAAAKKTSPGEWITGHGWDQNKWEDGYGNQQELDAAADGKPVFLTAKSLHAAWLSSAALEAAGIHSETPDPVGGIYGRDKNGSLNGLVFENAVKLIIERIPLPPLSKLSEVMEKAMAILWSFGITGVHDFDPWSCFQTLEQMVKENRLKLRVLKSIPLDILDEAIGLGIHSGRENGLLRIGALKLFADGALGPQTAAMLEPYEKSHNTGMFTTEPKVIMELGRKALSSSISLATHAIGDKAVHTVLDIYAQLLNDHTLQRPRIPLRVEHAQLLPAGAADRFRELGVIASMQPIHAPADMEIAQKHWGKRCARAFAWRSILDAGGTLLFGSDAPVESANPFIGIHAAITRQRLDGTPREEGWIPDQRINFEEALNAYTTAPALASGTSGHCGTLQAGMDADLVVLPNSPDSLQPGELAALKPNATMVAGGWVWNNLDWRVT